MITLKVNAVIHYECYKLVYFQLGLCCKTVYENAFYELI